MPSDLVLPVFTKQNASSRSVVRKINFYALSALSRTLEKATTSFEIAGGACCIFYFVKSEFIRMLRSLPWLHSVDQGIVSVQSPSGGETDRLTEVASPSREYSRDATLSGFFSVFHGARLNTVKPNIRISLTSVAPVHRLL